MTHGRFGLLFLGTLTVFVCFPVLSNIFLISFTRNELLDIRNSTPDNLLLMFEQSDIFLDILVGGAAFLYKLSRRSKRGKRAGVLMKFRLRCQVFKWRISAPLKIRRTTTPHPHKQGLFKHCCALLHGNLAEWSYPKQRASSNRLPAVQGVTESSGKTRDGGLCFYIN